MREESLAVQTASLPAARRQGLDGQMVGKALGVCFLLLERAEVAVSAFGEAGSREAAGGEDEEDIFLANGSGAAGSVGSSRPPYDLENWDPLIRWINNPSCLVDVTADSVSKGAFSKQGVFTLNDSGLNNPLQVSQIFVHSLISPHLLMSGSHTEYRSTINQGNVRRPGLEEDRTLNP